MIDIFPYRKHLEQEIEYLKTQLAQKNRQIDMLQEVLLQANKPKVAYVKDKASVTSVPVQPKGIEEFRAWRKVHPEPEHVDLVPGPYGEKEKDAVNG